MLLLRRCCRCAVLLAAAEPYCGTTIIVKAPEFCIADAELLASFCTLLCPADADCGDVVHYKHEVLLEDAAGEHQVHLQSRGHRWQAVSNQDGGSRTMAAAGS
jgi:hypothetical protein